MPLALVADDVDEDPLEIELDLRLLEAVEEEEEDVAALEDALPPP